MTLGRWPVEPRPGQREKAEELAKLLIEGRRVVFSAPTGWGKTIAVLAALTEADLLPAVWLVRSLVLGKRVVEDASRWGLSAFIAAGREKTCLMKDKIKDVGDYCRYYRYKCPYARPPPNIPNVVNYDDLVKKGQKESWCPYFAQDLIFRDITIQNYLKRMRPSRAIQAFIVDEAHNLILPREKTYTISQIVEAIASARQLGASERLLRGLEAVTSSLLLRDGVLDATLYIDDETGNEVWRLHLQGLERGLSLRPLLDLLSIAYVEGERVTIYTPQPSVFYRPAVFVSATLPPGSELLLNVDAAIKVNWEIKPKCIITSDMTTRYEEFDSKMALRYRRLLIETSRRYKRVLVFAPSERVAKELRGISGFEECEPPRDWEGIALFRARGRFSEGVDIPADVVVIAGAPFLPPSVGEWLARQMRRTGVKDPVRAAIDMPMLVMTLQCVGRAWRDPQRPPYVILADQRFERYVAVLQEFFILD